MLSAAPNFSTKGKFKFPILSYKFIFIIFYLCLFFSPAFAGTSIPFTINLSETVNVDTTGGTPRVVVNVDGNTRYATYTSGTGTSALIFTYDMTIGDVDLDGVTLTSPIDLNGGTIKDLNGNDATLTFTPPNTSNVKVNYPSLGMDFLTDRYTLNGTVYNDQTSFNSAADGSWMSDYSGGRGLYFSSTGILTTPISGAPRVDYDPITLTPKGLLIEQETTNLSMQSENLGSTNATSGWPRTSVTVLANNTASPTLGITAEKIVPSATSANHYIQKNFAFGGSDYTFSIYMKDAGYQYGILMTNTGVSSAIFNLQSGNIVSSTASAKITPAGNGWYRCIITVPASDAATNIQISFTPNNSFGIFTGDGTSGGYAWGGQLVSGSYPYSYRATTTATRLIESDAYSMYSYPLPSWYNLTKGTIYI